MKTKYTLEGSREIGKVGSHYGGMFICKKDGACFWSIGNYDGYFWEQIPETLFNELNAFEDLKAQKEVRHV